MTTRELSRREYLQAMTAAGLATLAHGAPRLRAEPVQHPKPTADTVILLWMAGGMGAPDTFDPKRYTKFEVGVPVDRILSTFPAIDTVVDNIKLTEGLETRRQGHRPRHAHPLARRCGPRQHPSLAPPVPLAYRVRPTPDGRVPAHRLVDGPRARAT